MVAVLWILLCFLSAAFLAALACAYGWRWESTLWERHCQQLNKRVGPITRAALDLDAALAEFGPDPAAIGEVVQRLEEAMRREIPGVFDETQPAQATKPPTRKRWPL